MPFTLTMPKLSPTMESGNIVKWHKKVGDFVEAGDLLIEVATDKATVEHNALDPGYLREILIKEGDEAVVNQPIAIFTETKTESITDYKPEGIEVKPAAVVEEKKDAAKTKEKPAEKAVTMASAAFVPEAPLEDYEFEVPSEAIEGRIKASPLARKLAKEQGLDITTVKGTGPGGRIVKEDLDKAQKTGLAVFGSRERPLDKPGSYEEEKLSPMRQVIARRLQEAKTFIPHFYVQQNINAEFLVQIREQLSKKGIKLTLNDFVVRACALALKEHPEVNSGFNSVNNTIIRYKTIDVCVAVAVDEGLITPIIRHADYKNLGELSVEIRSLAARAKEGKLQMHEYKGGSFTVSNMGMYGINNFLPIINPPQAAILAIGAVQNIPVVKEGRVVPGKVMNISLSADHRVVDGALASKFVKTVQDLLENPAVLLV
jgi:pyruvate dehydrogenase E2 component (dihydrolipoamide acetyltransferase)